MSKAFVKDDDGGDDDDQDLSGAPVLPTGRKNYMTPKGEKKLRDELHHLLYTERPEVTRVVSWAASNGDRSENGDYLYGKKRLREIDRRIRFLTKRLEAAEIIDPEKVKSEKVQFGATVTLAYEDGTQKTWSIVGIDEADATQKKISWISPLAGALLNQPQGEVVLFRSPKGEEELEILKIQYIPIE
jgi:transcription elongation factor GreB